MVIHWTLQEALNNVAKHSEAGRVRVYLGKGQGTMELSIKDHGEGFELASVLNYQAEKPGFGLASMRERTRAIRRLFSPRIRERQGSSERGLLACRMITLTADPVPWRRR